MSMLNRMVWAYLACTVSGLALGQQQPTPQLAADRAVTLNLDAQPLKDALHAFSQATGLKVMFLTELGRNFISAPVSGTLKPEDALKLLLKGADVRFKILDSQTIAVLPAREKVSNTGFHPTSRVDADTLGTASATSVADTPAGGAAASTAEGARGSNGTELSGAGTGKREGIEEVIVTAQKREERLLNVPISISVLDGPSLDKSSSVGVTDALNQVPGVVASAGTMGGGTQVTVRGVGASGPLFNGSSPIGYYLDSVPFGLVKNAIAPDSDAYDLARVEVLRGPQGTLYGAGGENGVVRILTHDADLDRFELKARTSGSYTDGGAGANYRGDLAVNVPIVDGKLAARAVVGYQDLSGWIDSPTETHTNDAVLRNYRLKVNAQPVDNLTVGLSAWISNDNYGAPSASTRDRKWPGPVDQPIHNTFDAYDLKLGYELPSVLITSMTSYLHYSSSSVLDLTPLGAPLPYPTWLPADVLSEEVNFSSTPQSDWKWTAGVFYRDATDRQHQQLLTFSLQDYTNQSKSSAVFGQIGRRFWNDQFEWGLGARYFHDDVSNRENVRDPGLAISTDVVPLYYAKNSFNSTTPRAVLTWYPSHELTVYGSYSEGFRSGFPQNASVAVPATGFPPLKPDKLRNFEVGAKADLLDHRLGMEAAVYYMKWNDVQQTISVPYANQSADIETTVTALINGQSASGAGVDFAVTARPIDGFDFGLNFSWNDLSLDDVVISGGLVLFNKGDRLNYSPEFTGGAFADYSFPFGGSGYEGRLSASANYSSKQENRGLAAGVFVVEGDSLINSRASFAIVSPHHWTATVFGDNLNNEAGGLPPFSPGEGLNPRLRPRTVGLQVDYSY